MTNTETPARQRRPKEETARLGDEIYRRDVKAQVETDHDGEYVAIDVDSRNWAIAESELAASDSLRAQCPDATTGCRREPLIANEQPFLVA